MLKKGARCGLNVRRFVLAAGPGLVVMLADTEAGSVMTAAQSGAQWGYRLLPLQFLIIPLLYVVQELTVRLGCCTGKGYGELIVRHYGRKLALLPLAALAVSCFGALVTELSGLAGVGQLYGVAPWQVMGVLIPLTFLMICTGSYRSVERIAIVLGVFELAFLLVAWKSHPDWRQMVGALHAMPLSNAGFMYLLAANLGTSVMPWTVFYQQSAIVDKGLTPDALNYARIDTLLGAVLCQVVTAAVLVAAAAAFGARGAGLPLDSIPGIARAFTAVLGSDAGRLLFAMGLSGGALVAMIVVCLCASWALGEVTGVRHSLEHHPFEAPWFYGSLGVMLLAGGVLVSSGVNLLRLSIAAGVINAVLLPVVLGFLYCLARRALPAPWKLSGGGSVCVALLFGLTATVGLYAGIAGTWG